MSERLYLVNVRNPEKLRQAVLYFLHQFGPLTEKHLIYLLYQLDFDHLERYRRSVTDGDYVKGREHEY